MAEIHPAMAAGRLTARQLVQLYLDRIAAYDKQGPALNAIVTVNPAALARADSLDLGLAPPGRPPPALRARADSLDLGLARTGRLTGPLHGIPVIIKDNYDTRDLPTTAGSLSLQGSIPPEDAYQVRRLRQAGAIVLAKSNMAEFAFSPYAPVGPA